MKFPRIIAVDFDGTLVENEFPKIGPTRDDVIERLKAEKAAGSKIILWTCRRGRELTDALLFCWTHDIELDAINANLPEMVEMFGGDTRKIYASEYWDDKAVKV